MAHGPFWRIASKILWAYLWSFEMFCLRGWDLNCEISQLDSIGRSWPSMFSSVLMSCSSTWMQLVLPALRPQNQLAKRRTCCLVNEDITLYEGFKDTLKESMAYCGHNNRTLSIVMESVSREKQFTNAFTLHCLAAQRYKRESDRLLIILIYSGIWYSVTVTWVTRTWEDIHHAAGSLSPMAQVSTWLKLQKKHGP